MNLQNNYGFDENAVVVLKKRYCLKDEDVIDVFRRSARCAASVEVPELIPIYEDAFFVVMMERRFIPNSPMLSGAETDLNLMACFVLPIEDSMESIFNGVKDVALIHKSGGGTGFTFSQLRPEGDTVKTTSGAASGPISFMRIIDMTTEIVKQGGKRRGANMGILAVSHPDIEKFIDSKSKEGILSNFNLSVSITDEFMELVMKGVDFKWPLCFNGKVYKNISGLYLWKLIITGAWNLGEPGSLFIDTINRYNPARDFQTIEAVNPCGESPLGPYEACCLGSINLSKFVIMNGTPTHRIINIDWDKLKSTVEIGVRLLDNIIDKNKYPIIEIEQQSKKFRKIGLGVMGWADMLLKLEISYNSPQALELAEKMMKFINKTSHKYSEELRIEKGPMGLFENDTESQHPLNKRRNSTLTIIAPTGTLSLIAGCSAGIEPVFSFEYKKKCLDGEMIVKHPIYEQWQEDTNYQLPYDKPEYFVESKDIPIEQHVRMQAAFQKYTDGAVSKTINAPNSATVEDVDKAFKLAWKLGIKGITVYRDGSREFQAQTAVRGETKSATILDQPTGFDHSTDAIKYITIPEAKKLAEEALIKAESERSAVSSPDQETPTWLPGWREKVKTGSGTLWVHVFVDPDTGFREVWTAVSKPGRDMAAAADSTGRLITLALRHGASWDEIVKQLQGHIGENTVWDNGVQIMSIQDGTAKVIRKRCVDNILPDFTCPFNEKCQKVNDPSNNTKLIYSDSKSVDDDNEIYRTTGVLPSNAELCPDCATILIHDEGCKGGRCSSCGWSNCS